MLVLTACASTTTVESGPEPDHAILWAAHAAEYQAISLQVYAQATRDLPRFIADTSWSALPGHDGVSDKPPAIILDVDETVTSGVDMELTIQNKLVSPTKTKKSSEIELSKSIIGLKFSILVPDVHQTYSPGT